MIVDEMHEEHPELLKDQFWEDVVPKDLPYTVASEHYRRHEPACSADHYKVKEADAVYANMHNPRKSNAEDTYADYESVDTPLVERRKNWFQRQISRMGSVRSASTAYSSGGLFGRNRHNSVVYSSPEVGQLPQANAPVLQHKMSLYDRLVGRKSGRGNKQSGRQGLQKVNGSIPITLKNRPRIPTPDVTKEVVDRENRFGFGNQTASGHMGVALMAHHSYASEVPVLGALVLSPIQEMDGGSVNNTLHAGQPGTAALAQAVLSPAMSSAGLGSLTINGSPRAILKTSPITTSMTFTPVTVTQLSTLGISTETPSTPQINRSPNAQRSVPSIVELPSDNGSDHGSTEGNRSRKSSSGSNSNARSLKRGEVYV